MNFRSTDQIEKQTSTEPLISSGFLQSKSSFDEQTFDGGKFADLYSPEHTFNSTSIGMSKAPGFGHDFSLIPTHSEMVRQAMPSLSTGTMVQRFPVPTTEETPPAPEAAPSPAAPEAEEELAAPEETAAPALIVEDSVTELSAGQMRKSDFLAQLRTAVTSTAESAMAGSGRTTADCPYLEYWFSYYSLRSAEHGERALRRYAPEASRVTSAREYIPIICGRVRRSVETWVRTGEITGVPEGMLGMGLLGSIGSLVSGIGSIFFKARSGGACQPNNPQAIQSQLGSGRSLDSGVRSRMESAFGMDFSQVRTHTDSTAAGMSDRLNARAFTVGEHIAFGSGEYRPGTLVGDAIIAHEMAHVVQQRGAGSTVSSMQSGDAGYDTLENDADKSAVGVLAGLWGGAKKFMADVAGNVMPALRSGLRLSRCTEDEDEEKGEPEKKTPEVPPKVDPEAVMASYVRGTLKDKRLEPSEWTGIRKRAAELKIDEFDFKSILSFKFDFAENYGDVMAEIVFSDNPIIQKMLSRYSTSVTGPPYSFKTDPLPVLVKQLLKDWRLNKEELNALREFYWLFDEDQIRTELGNQNIGDPTRATLLSILQLGYSDYQVLISEGGFFPIVLQKGEAGELRTSKELPQVIVTITKDKLWSHSEFEIVRSILRGMSSTEASTFLISSGFEESTAAAISREFSRPDKEFDKWVRKRKRLELRFQKRKDKWELTTESKKILALPWHPTLVSPLVPIGGKAIEGKGKSVTDIGSRKFASGTTTDADEMMYQFRGHTFKMIFADDLYEDESLFDRIDEALSIIPAIHINLIKQLVLDPGNDPGGEAIATASREGVVHMYFSGAGPHISQASLNRTTAHEFGHLASFKADIWDKWGKAMADDGMAVSRYALTNRYEDFAETYVLYLSGGRSDKNTRSRYERRFAILDGLF